MTTVNIAFSKQRVAICIHILDWISRCMENTSFHYHQHNHIHNDETEKALPSIIKVFQNPQIATHLLFPSHFHVCISFYFTIH